jgi:diguanylate cyclase (GGDEF)-like protein
MGANGGERLLPPMLDNLRRGATSIECNSGGEAARLTALHRYDVLDTEPEEAFDRITRLARTVLGMPIVLVSLIDKERQWFKSRQGLGLLQTPRNASFCNHTIRDSEPLIVPDARTDPRFADIPLVIEPPHVRFYIGVPLRTRDGYNIGALCAMDTKVRELTADQIAVMKDLAKLVVDEMELRTAAAIDSLTGAMSRRSFSEEANRDIERARRHDRPLSCVLIDVDDFKSINDTHGHPAGDQLLERLVSICKSSMRATDYVGRIGGDEFAIMLPEASMTTALEITERVRKAFAEAVIRIPSGEARCTLSIGIAALTAEINVDALLSNADVAMYAAKSGGRNRIVCGEYLLRDANGYNSQNRRTA